MKPPNMSRVPHMRLKYVKAACAPYGSSLRLSAINGVNVAVMCTMPISITPIDSTLVMYCLFIFIIVYLFRKRTDFY